MFISGYTNIHGNNRLFLSSCIHMQYNNKVKNSIKKDGYRHVYLYAMQYSAPRTIVGHILIHYNNSTSLSDITMYFNIHYFKKCNINKWPL